MADKNILTPTKPANKEILNSKIKGTENGISWIPPFPQIANAHKVLNNLETNFSENLIPSTRISVTGTHSPNYYTNSKTTQAPFAADTSIPPDLASPSITGSPRTAKNFRETTNQEFANDFLSYKTKRSLINNTSLNTGFPLSLPYQNSPYQSLHNNETTKSPNYNEQMEFITSPFADSTTPVNTSSTLSPLAPTRPGVQEKSPSLYHDNQKDENVLPLFTSPVENYFQTETIKFPSLEELCQMGAYKPQYSPLPTIRKRTSTSFDQGQRFEYISSLRELLSPHLGGSEADGPNSPIKTDTNSIKKLLETPENIPLKRHRGSLSLSTQTPQTLSSPLPSPIPLIHPLVTKELTPGTQAYTGTSPPLIESPAKPRNNQNISNQTLSPTYSKEYITNPPCRKSQLHIRHMLDNKEAQSMDILPQQPQNLPSNVFDIQISSSLSPLSTREVGATSPPRGTLIINTRDNDIESSLSEYSEISETPDFPTQIFEDHIIQSADSNIVRSDDELYKVDTPNEWPSNLDLLNPKDGDFINPSPEEIETRLPSGIDTELPTGSFDTISQTNNNQIINSNSSLSSVDHIMNLKVSDSSDPQQQQSSKTDTINNFMKERNIPDQSLPISNLPSSINKSLSDLNISTSNSISTELNCSSSTSKVLEGHFYRSNPLTHPFEASQVSTQDIDKQSPKSDSVRIQNRSTKQILLKKKHQLKHSLDMLWSIKVDYDIATILKTLSSALNHCKPPKAVELLKASNDRLEKELESKANFLDQMSKQEQNLRDELAKEEQIIENLENQLQSELLQKERKVLKDQKKEKEQADCWENFIGIKLVKFSRDILVVSFSWNDRPWSNSLMEDLQSPPSTINPSGEPQNDSEVFKNNIWGELGIWPPHAQLIIQWQPSPSNRMSTFTPKYRRTTHGHTTMEGYQKPKLLKYFTSHNNYNDSAIYRQTSNNKNDDDSDQPTFLREKEKIMKYKSIDIVRLRLQSQYNYKAHPDTSDGNWRQLCDVLREQLIHIIEARLQESMMVTSVSDSSRLRNENYGKFDLTQKEKLLNSYDFQLLEGIIEEIYNNFNNAALLLKQFKMFIGQFRCITTAQYDDSTNNKTKMQLRTGIFSSQDDLPCFWLTFELILQDALNFGSLIMAISDVSVDPMDPEDQDWEDTRNHKDKIEESLKKNLMEWKDELLTDLSSPTEQGAIYSMSTCVIETLKSINYDAGISLDNYNEFKAFLDQENQFIGNLMQFTSIIKTIKLTS